MAGSELRQGTITDDEISSGLAPGSLSATFTVADSTAEYGRVDHDWMFDDPELFESNLDDLGLHVLSHNGSAA